MKKLTATHEVNTREVEMMVGKAMCAWANYESAMNSEKQLRAEHGDLEFEKVTAAQLSEYEATIRILEFFVDENIYEIQDHVIDRAEKML